MQAYLNLCLFSAISFVAWILILLLIVAFSGIFRRFWK